MAYKSGLLSVSSLEWSSQVSQVRDGRTGGMDESRCWGVFCEGVVCGGWFEVENGVGGLINNGTSKWWLPKPESPLPKVPPFSGEPFMLVFWGCIYLWFYDHSTNQVDKEKWPYTMGPTTRNRHDVQTSATFFRIALCWSPTGRKLLILSKDSDPRRWKSGDQKIH